MEQTTLGVFFPPDCMEQAQRFFERYELKGIVANGDPAYAKRSLRGYSTRMCRFCNRTYPEAPFSRNSRSHLLSQLIGNTSLFSEFECDECNQRFSVYEDGLAAYLGISRSIVGYSPDKKTKGFKGSRLSAKSRSFIGENVLILAPEDTIREKDRLLIHYTKNPFVPNYVYRALLKSAISLLNDSDANENYRLVLEYLKGKDFIDKGAEFSGYQLSFGVNLPLHVYRFEKKRSDDPIPTHVFAFYFQNRIIVFPLPFHRQDLVRFGSGYNVLVPPPCFVSEEDRDIAMPIPFRRDFSSGEKIDNEEETLTMILNPEVLKDACVYDSVTGKIEPGDSKFGTTKYLILVKKGMIVDPAEFSEFIKREMEP